MAYSRGKVQILYNHLPGALFPHDDYGYCKVTRVELEEGKEVNRKVVLETLADTLLYWKEDWQKSGFPDPRLGDRVENYYKIGTPTTVYFEPFPQSLQCHRCNRVYPLDRLKRSTTEPGLCLTKGCGGNLGQLRFVEAHNCGRLKEIYLNHKGCPSHGTQGLYFDDTGRVTTARWRCHLCGGAEISKPRQTPCSCSYTTHGALEDKQKRMRFFPVSDPALFRAKVIPFVNFDQETLATLSHPEAQPFILARIWGMLDLPVSETIEKHLSSAQSKEEETETEKTIRELAKFDPNNKLVIQWKKKKEGGENSLKKVKTRVEELVGSTNIQNSSRKMVEQVALIDSLNTLTVSKLQKRLKNQGDEEGIENLNRTMEFAKTSLGLTDIRAVEDFPIGLCSPGYTRVSSHPSDTVLSPFPQEKGRIPLFTVATTTEALFFQLDPLRVVKWLNDNGWCDQPDISRKEEAWSWIYRRLPGLRQNSDGPDYKRVEVGAVRTLIHTMSHLFLRHIEWSGYAAESLGEYLIPETLSCVLYASRYQDTKVGGLLTLFEQRLYEWLDASYQGGENCMFDPFCSDRGGACVGCLHREYNCPLFNSELSRSVLYGGTRGEGKRNSIIKGYWE